MIKYSIAQEHNMNLAFCFLWDMLFFQLMYVALIRANKITWGNPGETIPVMIFTYHIVCLLWGEKESSFPIDLSAPLDHDVSSTMLILY